MAYIDPFTGELCLRIAYAGHTWADFEYCVSVIKRRQAKHELGPNVRLANGLYMAWFRPDGLSCRGRRVKIELVGMARRTPEPESALRIMLRDVSGIVHLTRGVTHELKQIVWYQDVVNRALAFWQYDPRGIPQITQFNGRYCSKCGQSFVDDDLISPLLNPWGAPEMWSNPLHGTGVLEAFDALLERALDRAERCVGPPICEQPRTVAPDAMARRAFDLVDTFGQGDLFPPEDRRWLLERARHDGEVLAPACPHVPARQQGA